MDIQDLHIFARVAALQNLSAVGNELGLTPGTISKRLQALEQSLKARLFDRTTRSIRITDEGAMLLVHAERILSEIELARTAVGASTERPAGKLKISAPLVLSRKLLSPALVSFVEGYPEIEVRIDVTDRLVNLQEDGYDAAIRIGGLDDSSLKAKRLAPDRVILAAARSYLDRRGMPRRPADLADHECLLQGDARNWLLVGGRVPVNIRVNGRLQSDTCEVLHHAAASGLGILRASEIALADDITAGRLVRVLPEYELAINAGVWAVYPSGKHVPQRLRVFLDHLARVWRDMLPIGGVNDNNLDKGTPAAGGPAAAKQAACGTRLARTVAARR